MLTFSNNFYGAVYICIILFRFQSVALFLLNNMFLCLLNFLFITGQEDISATQMHRFECCYRFSSYTTPPSS